MQVLIRKPWVFVPAPSAAARLRMVCFPHAGGGASIFSAWPQGLPGDVEVCAVQMPGRESRLGEPPLTRWEDVIEQLSEALMPFLDRPFVFFGHSLGATVAFEVARRLRVERWAGLAHLFVAGRRAPHIPPSEPFTYTLPDAEFVGELRRLTGTPEDVLRSEEMLELFLPVLRADIRLAETYVHRPGDPLTVPISAYGGETDEHVPDENLEGWQRHTTSAFRRVMFPGGHFFLHEHRRAVLAEIARDLHALRTL